MFQKDKISNWVYYYIIKINHVTMWNTSRPLSLHKNPSKLPAFLQTQMRKKRWNSTFKIYVPIIISILKLTSPSSQTKHVHI